MTRLNTVGKAWIVCSVGMERGARFTEKQVAQTYAENMARANPNREYEIFECVSMRYVDLPVTVVTTA